MTDDIFTLDENNNASVRTVSVNPGVSETDSPTIFTVDENGNACVRIAGSGGVDEDKVIVLSDTIPTADSDSFGKFYCYKGETNATYTHGYIYECVAGSVSYEANIVYPHSTFASLDFYKAGQLIVDAGVSDPNQVASGSMTYAQAGDIWSIVFKDENDNVLNTAYNVYTQDLADDYDIQPVVDPSDFTDGQVIDFTVASVTEHLGNFSWERVDVQPVAKLGRYLSGWDCETGLAMTNPPESPYIYTTGDYFIVGAVASGGGDNYRPDGSSYTTGVASSTVETEVVNINDTYLYDGTNWTLLKTGSAVTSVNGQIGDVNIKKVNGNDLVGTGDIELSTYLPLPTAWTTTGTTFSFCDDIANDTTAVEGKAYLGEVTLNDLPANMGNAEIVVEIMKGTTANDKVIVLTITSGNTAPYMWKYTYWNNGADVSGWIGFEQNFRFDTLPTPSSDWLDKVVQYTGPDNGTLYNGYFYVCTFDGANYDWTQKNVQPASAQSDWNEQDPNSPAYIQNKPTDLSDFSNNDGFVTMKNTTAQLDMNNWTGNMQTVNVPGVDPAQTIVIAPNPASMSDYATAGIVCSNVYPDTLEFKCTNTPNVNIDVEVVIYE